MIRKLRRQFIAIAMISVLVVLGGIIGVVNAVNFRNVRQDADMMLDVIAANDGVYSMEKKRQVEHIILP